jgi:hypothetical protein
VRTPPPQVQDRMEVLDLLLSGRPGAYADLDALCSMAHMLGIADREEELRLKVASVRLRRVCAFPSFTVGLSRLA